MKFCTNCGEKMEDDVLVCPKCGKPSGVNSQADTSQNAAQTNDNSQMQGQPMMQAQPYQQPYMGGPNGAYQQPMYSYDPTDHTREMDPQDIADNKILAVAMYVLSWMGIIVALLAARDSKFVGFHLRQVLKLCVTETLVGIISLALCWTFIVPILGGICAVILFVLQIIGFVNTCSGKAKEIPIINTFKFL